jgi:hypothetical protein
MQYTLNHGEHTSSSNSRNLLLPLQQSAILLHISNYKKMIHLKFSAPSPVNWVVSDRDMVCTKALCLCICVCVCAPRESFDTETGQ